MDIAALHAIVDNREGDAARCGRAPGLSEAGGRLLEDTELTPSVVFISALVILLGEGLEAILAAIAAFMIKTGRGDATR